jgi:predicted transcriptional regulator
MRYIPRMVETLVENGELTVSNLAMLSRTNHRRCNDMLRWLQGFGYVRRRVHDNRRFIVLTESGIEFAKCLEPLKRMTEVPT